MKNKRKEILRDLLGEFGSGDEDNEDNERENEIVKEPVEKSEYMSRQNERELEQEDLADESEYKPKQIGREIEREDRELNLKKILFFLMMTTADSS
jgi:hypothetical protein